MKHKFVSVFLVGFLAAYCGLHAQDLAYNGGAGDSYKAAMNLAHNGHHQAARDTLQRVLSLYPQNSDFASLLAKTYSWDGQYDEARKHFNRITSRERSHKDSWLAAIQNERFAGNLLLAFGLTNKALTFLEGDEELLMLQAQILGEIEMEQIPSPAGGDEGEEKETETKVFRNQLGIISSLDVFDVVYDPMVYSCIEYVRDTDLGRIIPRINYSHRFQINGLQYELDLYPRLSERFYGYLNYGYSEAAIFPNHRAGAELYATLPGGIETSLGMRYLQFQTGQAQLYTASLGWYTGNYYFSMRPFVNPRTDGSTGFSGVLQARKYLRDKDNYLSVILGLGFTPELKQLRADGTLLAETLLYIESQQLLLEYQFSFGQRPFVYRALLGLTRQELLGNSGSYFWALTAGLRYHVKF